VGHELFAIDGCKMRSNASKEWSGTFKELEQKRQKLRRLIQHHLSEHQEKAPFKVTTVWQPSIKSIRLSLMLKPSVKNRSNHTR